MGYTGQLITSLVFGIIGAVLLVIALSVYLGEYVPSTADDVYQQGTCVVVDNSNVTKCFVNYCEYTYSIHIEYIGKIEILEGIFEVYITKMKSEGEKYMADYYPNGSETNCYYSENSKDPLRINPRHPGNIDAYRAAMFFFACMGLAFLIALLCLIPCNC